MSGSVWLDGEWTQRRGRWAWKVGRWIVPPPQASYAPWAFVRAPDGSLYFAPGAFRDADGKPVDEPAPLSVGKADEIAVVDADGQTDVTGRTLRAATTTGRSATAGLPPATSVPAAYSSGRIGDVP